MALRFRPRRSNQGFDAFSKPETQVIPLNETRTIIVNGNENLIPRFRWPGGAEPVFPEAKRRMVLTLRGSSPAHNVIEWVPHKNFSGTVPEAQQLQVHVLPELKFRTTFNFVTDGPGEARKPASTDRRPGIVDKVVEETNRILQRQMNVCVESIGIREKVVLKHEIGKEIRVKRNPAAPGARDHWDKVIAEANPIAKLNVFFVWDVNVEDERGEDTVGASLAGEPYVLIDNKASHPGVTLAHELLHVLGRGHTTNRSHLMAETYEEGGIFIPSNHATLAHIFARVNGLGEFNPPFKAGGK